MSHYRLGAKQRGLVFGLKKEQAYSLFKKPCAYCGASPDPLNGIDRVDSRKGYLTSNVVTACGDCNRSKGVRSVANFVAWAKRVASRKA